MPMVPMRDIGKLGVIADVDPFDLPTQAFSFGNNVRFEDNKVERGAVFRRVGSTLPHEPRHILGYTDVSGAHHTVVVSKEGYANAFNNATFADVSPASGWTPAASEAPVTSCVLQNIQYINRSDRTMWYRSKTAGVSTPFTIYPTAAAPAGWASDFRCKALRSYAGVLVALNVTKGASSFPSMVKWSDFAQYSALPANWDYGSTTSSAGENTLAQMRDDILDGHSLRNRFFIFSSTETFFMEYIGGNDMFRFDKSFDRGVINVNCVVEYNGLHYVFGEQDIWVHDGVSERSIAQGRVRKFIYNSMRRSSKDTFFTVHNKNLNEIAFCFVSDDPYVRFPAPLGAGCNRAAIYNYAADTWSFADLPYLTHAANLRLPVSGDFDSETETWDEAGGSWQAALGDPKENLLTVGIEAAAYGLDRIVRSFDAYASVSTVFPIDPAANPGALLERTGLDLDEADAELIGYKLCSCLVPQGRFSADANPLVFTVGSSDHPDESPIWGISQTWDRNFNRVDHNVAGRYLHYRIEQNGYRAFSLSGFDLDLTLLGKR
jgi:hypothetical protein